MGVVVLALIVPFLFAAGVLAAIAIPAFSDYSARAKAAQSQQAPQ
jgi:Tfp pilus assembly protein PilE